VGRIELDEPDWRRAIEVAYESRANARPKIQIAIVPPDADLDEEDRKKVQQLENDGRTIILEDADLAHEILQHHKAGGQLRLQVSLKLTPPKSPGNPLAVCPCDVEP
jgi:hypothetical protein